MYGYLKLNERGTIPSTLFFCSLTNIDIKLKNGCFWNFICAFIFNLNQFHNFKALP